MDGKWTNDFKGQKSYEYSLKIIKIRYKKSKNRAFKS